MEKEQILELIPADRRKAFEETGDVDASLIKAVLDAKFLGKEYRYMTTSDMYGVVRDLLAASPKYERIVKSYTDFSCDFSSSRQEVTLQYRRQWLAQIGVKKERGKWHSSLWGTRGSYEWAVKEIAVSDVFDNLEERVKNIDESLAVKESQETQYRKECVELAKKILTLRPSDSYYDVMRKLKFLADHTYELKKEIEGDALK